MYNCVLCILGIVNISFGLFYSYFVYYVCAMDNVYTLLQGCTSVYCIVLAKDLLSKLRGSRDAQYAVAVENEATWFLTIGKVYYFFC